MVLKYLLEKEFKQIWRNPIILGVLVVFVTMVLFLFPWAVNFEAKNIGITIVDQDRSPQSMQLISKVIANKSFRLHRVVDTYRSGYQDIESSDASVLLCIPKDFAKDLLGKQSAEVQIFANAVDGSQASLGSSYLAAVVNDYADNVRVRQTGLSLEEISPVQIVPRYRFNPSLDYKAFMLPAFVVMILTMFCGILPGLNIIIEKETGTIQQINVTPIKRHTYILGKIIPFWVLGLGIYALSLLVIWLIYGLSPTGSIGTLILAGFIYIASISGIGILVSNFSETLQQGMFLILFFILILFLLSGLFTPVSAMPGWAKVIAYGNPLTYFIKVMRLIYLKGAGFMDVLPQLGILALFGVVLNTASILTLKKRN